MKREELQRMLSQTDEKYISEITESESIPDFQPADEVSGEAEEVRHIFCWQNWAAAAAVLLVCGGLGAFLFRSVPEYAEFQAGNSVSDFTGEYEVPESESQYQEDSEDPFVFREDSRFLSLKGANQLDFCKGLVPQTDILAGENEKINGRNLGMNGEYCYENLYDDSNLLLNEENILYHVYEISENENAQEVSYCYSNSECSLHLTYSTVLPDGANLAEDSSPKITLQEPFSTIPENRGENSRLKNWDFWLDLDICYLHLEGTCTMNQEDNFIGQLNYILIAEPAGKRNLYSINILDNLCQGLVPQATKIGDMRFIMAVKGEYSEDSLTLYYENQDRSKTFTVIYSDMDSAWTDIAYPALTAEQLTEEGLQNAGIFTEYQGLFISCERCLIEIEMSGCEQEDLMPYLSELKALIQTADCPVSDLP